MVAILFLNLYIQTRAFEILSFQFKVDRIEYKTIFDNTNAYLKQIIFIENDKPTYKQFFERKRSDGVVFWYERFVSHGLTRYYSKLEVRPVYGEKELVVVITY